MIYLIKELFLWGDNMPVIRKSADLCNNYSEISEFCHSYREPIFITKKLLIFLLLFLCVTLIYAEENNTEEKSVKNTISGGVSAIYTGYFFGTYILPGLHIEYERLLHENFTLAVDIGLDGLIRPHFDLYARWYPWAGMFFTNFGLGVWRQGFDTWILTPVISPGIGWKIDIGKPNGWNLTTGIVGRIFLYEDKDINDSTVNNNSTVDITAKVYFKVGYSF